MAGDTERAVAELAEARRLSPDDRYLSLSRLRKVENWGLPKVRALREATKFAGLRKAGMPEERGRPPRGRCRTSWKGLTAEKLVFGLRFQPAGDAIIAAFDK